ncbi:hypothetical protein BPAE_0037g00690 [Botrytis paeoniae]|uniref:Uncharacterized protein n=1 Tax=Botrytis paeoniae TaxID=278948 RepID=A0A4Z1FST2_9HELO|nr:hypothetical protein BPAE_0037g00690 [Botrytis paeoniae]
MRCATRILLTPQLYHGTQHYRRLYDVTNACFTQTSQRLPQVRHLSQSANGNSAAGFGPLPDHEQHWYTIHALRHVVLSAGMYFDKLLLKQWENEAREGVDPENLRTLWKTFNDMPTVSEDIWVDDSYWVSGSASSTNSEFIPTPQFFLLIDVDIVASVTEGPANSEITFLYVVDPCYGLVEDDGDDGDPEYKGYLKISVEFFGQFWSNVSAGDVFNIEKLGPSDLVKRELFTSALSKEISKAAASEPQEADQKNCR